MRRQHRGGISWSCAGRRFGGEDNIVNTWTFFLSNIQDFLPLHLKAAALNEKEKKYINLCLCGQSFISFLAVEGAKSLNLQNSAQLLFGTRKLAGSTGNHVLGKKPQKGPIGTAGSPRNDRCVALVAKKVLRPKVQCSRIPCNPSRIPRCLQRPERNWEVGGKSGSQVCRLKSWLGLN